MSKFSGARDGLECHVLALTFELTFHLQLQLEFVSLAVPIIKKVIR